MADEPKTNATPEAPGGPPVPEQTEQEVIKSLQKDYADLWGPLSDLLQKLSEVVRL